MASVKVSAHSLEQQKKEYEKAVENLDNALEQIKKVNASLGKDAMLDGVRQALTKLAASLETRAGVILLMTKALEQSNAKYTAAQKKAVTKSNQFRAHNRDFYGNPVVVTVVAGGAGATAGALSGAAAVAETTGTTPAASNVASGTVTDASNAVSGTGGSVHIKSQGTVNVSSQTDSDIRQAVYTQRGPSATIAQVSEHARNVAAPKAADSLTDIPEKETVAMASEILEPGSAPAITGAVAAGAAAAGAAIGSIAGGSIKRIKQPEPFTKEKKQDPSTDIEAQLEAARERLRRFNEMEMEEKE
ncbi:MAG: hypothetical protein ACLVFN_05645 [Enterocloster sp.]